MPPGYRDKADKKEEDAYLHNGLIFQRQFGDCILWQELVDIAKTDGRFKHVIFVTDDQKEDWWWIQESAGKKTMGPRPELVEEIMLSGNVKGFYMYNPERFLEYAKTALGVQLKDDTIEQVRGVSESRSIDDLFFNSVTIAEIAVANYMNDSGNYATVKLVGKNGIEAQDEDFHYTVEVIEPSKDMSLDEIQRMIAQFTRPNFSLSPYSRRSIYVIVPSRQIAAPLEAAIRGLQEQIYTRVLVTIALLVHHDTRPTLQVLAQVAGSKESYRTVEFDALMKRA